MAEVSLSQKPPFQSRGELGAAEMPSCPCTARLYHSGKNLMGRGP